MNGSEGTPGPAPLDPAGRAPKPSGEPNPPAPWSKPKKPAPRGPASRLSGTGDGRFVPSRQCRPESTRPPARPSGPRDAIARASRCPTTTGGLNAAPGPFRVACLCSAVDRGLTIAEAMDPAMDRATGKEGRESIDGFPLVLKQFCGILRASMAIQKKNAFSRRLPDLVTEELVAVLSQKKAFEFKQLFEIVHENLRQRNAASGGEEMLRLRAYEKLQNLVARGAVKKNGKSYKGDSAALAAMAAANAAQAAAAPAASRS
jgi:hypothetical protein